MKLLLIFKNGLENRTVSCLDFEYDIYKQEIKYTNYLGTRRLIDLTIEEYNDLVELRIK
jgi:cell fate regulator YaaT (PSP1 superfamily)